MAYTPRAGRLARIMIDTSSAGTGAAVAVTGKNTWSIDQSVDTFETTSFGDPNKTFVVGLPNATGEIGGLWDSDDNLIYNVIGSSVARKLYIYPDHTNNVGTYFFTTAFFSVKEDGSVGGTVNASATFAAAGPAAWVHP